MRVEDEGESECRSVIERIRIERLSASKIIRRENEPTSLGSFVTRELD